MVLTFRFQVDFKLVGDATDLQPAAARMRYTRLRKAVEAGHFKGATLVQPNLITASLSQLANPHSKRLGNDSPNNEEQGRRQSLDKDSHVRETRAKPARGADIGEEEEVDDEDEEVIEGLEHLRCRKRRNSTPDRTASDDDSLFFPDTSRFSRNQKRAKCIGDRNEDDEERVRRIARSNRHMTTVSNMSPAGTVSNAHPRCRAGVNPHNVSKRQNEVHSRAMVSKVPATAEAAYGMGVKHGKWSPRPDVQNPQHQMSAYTPSQKHVQRNAYHETQNPRPPSDPPWQNGGFVGLPFRGTVIDPRLQTMMHHSQMIHPAPYVHATQGQPSNTFPKAPPHSTTRTTDGPQYAQSTNQNKRESNPLLHSHLQAQHQSNPQPNHPPAYPTHRAKPTELKPTHPSSVFEGFHAPTKLSYSPSRIGTGTGMQRNGEVSLLHKVMAEREKDCPDEPVEKRSWRGGKAMEANDGDDDDGMSMGSGRGRGRRGRSERKNSSKGEFQAEADFLGVHLQVDADADANAADADDVGGNRPTPSSSPIDRGMIKSGAAANPKSPIKTEK